MSIESELRDVIEKNLPAQVAGVFKNRLIELEDVEDDLKRLKVDHEKLQDHHRSVIEEKRGLEEKLNQYEEKMSVIEAKKEELLELGQELRIKEAVLVERGKREGIIISALQAPFQNRVLREDVLKSVVVDQGESTQYDTQNNIVPVANGEKIEPVNETRTTEEL